MKADSLSKHSTVGEILTCLEADFTEHDLFFGHGTISAWDEAVGLVLHVLALPPDQDDSITQHRLTDHEQQTILSLARKRIEQRLPLPYLTHQAWFAGLSFYVDERVIIPRSPLAEVIDHSFEPWCDIEKADRVLDLCTGSACIAIAIAHYFPWLKVDAVDIDADALDVAQKNVQTHGVESQVQLIQSDVFDALDGQQYDIIISNPPYVDAHDMATMPDEFAHEPELALASGEDGLDLTDRILAQAKSHLKEKGILIVEVGNSWLALEKKYPDLPLTWLEFERGGVGVFILRKDQL